METDIKAMLQKLAAPFPEVRIRWRAAVTGLNAKGEPWVLCVPYLTKIDICNRLDSAIGAQGWATHFRTGPGNSTICRLSIRIGDGWVAKEGVGEPTDISPARGSATQAFKNAALAWSIGRVYADLPSPMHGIVSENGSHRGSAKNRATGVYQSFNWTPPRLPASALPPVQLTVLNGDRPATTGFKESVKIASAPKAVRPAPSAPEVSADIRIEDVPASLRDLFAELQISDAKALEMLKRRNFDYAAVERILQDIRVDSVAAGA